MRPSFLISGVASGLRRNLSMTLALLLVTMVSLTFVGAALLSRLWISDFRQTYENRLNVSVYLRDDITADQLAALRTELAGDTMVRAARYISADEAFQRGKQVLDPATAEFLTPGVLPASFTIELVDQLTDYDAVAAKYTKAVGVDQVQNQDDALKTLLLLFQRVQSAALVAAIVVAFAALLLMFNTVRIAATQRRTETGIMRLVGATRWMVELPFIVEAMIATLVGGILAIGALAIGKVALFDRVLNEQIGSGVLPTLNVNDILINAGSASLVGILIAAITAWATLRIAVRL
jgi:cell division transport system permease protein